MPEQIGRQFAGDIDKCIVLNENICALIWISLKFINKDPTNNKSSLIISHNSCPNPISTQQYIISE